MELLPVLLGIGLVIIITSIREVKEYERGVRFDAGKFA